MTGSVGEHKTRYQHNNVTAWYCIARRRLRITRDEVTDKAASEDSFRGCPVRADAHCRAALEATMNTLTIFVIIIVSIIGVLIWCAIEDDRDERRRK